MTTVCIVVSSNLCTVQPLARKMRPDETGVTRDAGAITRLEHGIGCRRIKTSQASSFPVRSGAKLTDHIS